MPPKKPEWSCGACTVLNPASVKKCKLCKTARGEEQKEEGGGSDNMLLLDSQEERVSPKGGKKKRKVMEESGEEEGAPVAVKKKTKKSAEDDKSYTPTESDTDSDSDLSSAASSSTARQSQCQHVFKLTPAHTKDGWKYTCDSCQQESQPKDKLYVCKKKGCDYTLCKSCKDGKKKSPVEEKTPAPTTPATKSTSKPTAAKKSPTPTPAAKSPKSPTPAAGTPKTLGTLRLRPKASLSPGDGPKGRYSRPTASLRKPILRCGLAKPPPRLPDD